FVCSSVFAYVLPEDDSGAPYFYIFGPDGEATYGANKESNSLVFYIDFPEEETQEFWISLYDPDTGGRHDFRSHPDNPWDTITKISLYGAQLLQEEEFGKGDYDRAWFTFGPYLSSRGERVGNVYRFKLVVMSLQGDDANLFKIRIEPDSAEVFSYEFTVRLIAKEGDKMYFYPEIPGGTKEVLVGNYDLDPDGGTGILYDYLTGIHYKIKGSDTGQWAQTKVSLISSDIPRRLAYIITKGTQRNAHAGFRVSDEQGNSVPIYFKRTGPKRLAITEKPREERKTTLCNTFTFDATESYDPGNRKLTYLWDFGDGETSSEPVVTYTYKKAGSYKVTLTVKNDSGLECDTGVATETVKVNTSPEAVFTTPDVVCRGEEIVFDASGTTDNTPETLTYYWDFGDGTNGMGKIVTKSYERGGTYKVTLTVDDNEGTACSKGFFSKTVRVNTGPIAEAGSDINLCISPSEEYKVTFDGSKS
ncbi:MAG: PKD domain-containing protein, partial [Candidatus Omnitrophota bacterium]